MGKIRITGGRFPGKTLQSMEGRNTRPTLAKVRQALFNVLGCRIRFDRYRFLDLFAGFGAVSCEAGSRGFAQIQAIEKDSAVYGVLRKNFESLPVSNMRCLCTDAERFIESDSFLHPSVVFMDPPYESSLLRTSLKKLSDKRVLKQEDWVVLETNESGFCTDLFELHSQKSYGQTRLFFYKPKTSSLHPK